MLDQEDGAAVPSLLETRHGESDIVGVDDGSRYGCRRLRLIESLRPIEDSWLIGRYSLRPNAQSNDMAGAFQKQVV